MDELNERWAKERAELNKVGDLKTKLDGLRIEADRAQREGNLERASRLLYGEIPALEKELAALESAEANSEATGVERMVNDQVGEDDIAAVVSAWTGVPTGRLLAGESEKLLNLEAELGKRLIGQKAAVKSVSDAVRRTKAGIS
ncbi:MAG: hypothetical protein RL716_1155 [Actinomycetota bacterium]